MPASSGLTLEQRQQFQTSGFLILRQLAPAAVVEQMRRVTEDQLRRELAPVEYEAEVHYPGAPQSLEAPGGHTVRRLKQAHARDIVFTDWVSSPLLRDPLTALLGPRVVMPLAHHNCIMTKQPQHSSDTGWHQDIRYWSFERPELISVWLALGDEHLKNGCLQVIPGSHRIDFARERFDDALFFRTDHPANLELLDQAQPVELQAGDVLFFHCRTLHAATRNYSNETKYSAVFTFRAGDNPPRPGTRSAQACELLLPSLPDASGESR